MAEYIDRQEIIDMINAQRRAAATRKDFIGMIVLNYMLDVITNDDCVPAADVRPERRGRWDVAGDIVVECSACGEVYSAIMIPRHYCPNCGAKMDGKDGETNELYE